ncbi:MAG: 3,4-dihydroxy-2-butanone-4-phosphate synthase, partial [Planctomycetales bacterium]|nr:3,4-dihydroxy-2-butanone-4-phosphate synthase [Planctomycetales bacterium]
MTAGDLGEQLVSRQFSTVEQAVEAIARGEVIIVVDAEDRENEG